MKLRALLLVTGLAACGGTDGERLLVGATHTLEDSGILTVFADSFRAGYPSWRLQVVVASSGEVLELARRGDLDVVLTHSPDDELRFVEEGHALDRREVMRSDFLIIGPAEDPAGIRGSEDPAEALRRIAEAGALFVSRADDSGTHRCEQRLWQGVGGRPEWSGYIEAGAGMAEALRLADQRAAYILTERATWLVLRDMLALEPMVEGDPRLVNIYSVMRVAGAANPEGAEVFADWITGSSARALVEAFGSGFTPGLPIQTSFTTEPQRARSPATIP